MDSLASHSHEHAPADGNPPYRVSIRVAPRVPPYPHLANPTSVPLDAGRARVQL